MSAAASWFAARRFLVTGGAGFLGTHVVGSLQARGAASVDVVHRAEHDLRRREDCDAALARFRPDVVIHLAAAVGGIGANRRSPATFLHDNLLMGLHVVEACRVAGVEKLVVTGTVCAYPKHAPTPFREEDLWNGYPEETNAPYGIAKRAVLVHLQAAAAEHGLRSAYLLPANLYGPRDDFDPGSSHVIPALVRRMEEARAQRRGEVVLWGDGTPTREFLHVRDCAEATCLAAERLESPDPVNVGTGRETSIADLAGLVADATGFTGRIAWDTAQPNGQPRRCLDVTRARQRLGFEARVRLEEGIAELVAWYREHRAAGASR